MYGHGLKDLKEVTRPEGRSLRLLTTHSPRPQTPRTKLTRLKKSSFAEGHRSFTSSGRPRSSVPA